MSPEAESPQAETPEAAPDEMTGLRDALADRISARAATAPESPSPDATEADAGASPTGASAAPAADREPSAVPDVEGEQAQAAPDPDLEALPENSRRALLKQAEENLRQANEAKEAAEKRAADLEAIAKAGDEVLVSLTGTDDQLAELKRRARSGDYQAREQADIYEANRELLAPVKAVLRKQADQEALSFAWGTISEHFQTGARFLPEDDREGFLKAENVEVGMRYFAEKLTAPLKAENKALKAEVKALKAATDGYQARDAHRGAAPVAGGRSASGFRNPNASAADDIRDGLIERLRRTG